MQLNFLTDLTVFTSLFKAGSKQGPDGATG